MRQHALLLVVLGLEAKVGSNAFQCLQQLHKQHHRRLLVLPVQQRPRATTTTTSLRDIEPAQRGPDGKPFVVEDDDESGYRETLLRLAKWSLEDYEWRSSVFKSNEADRMVEETIAHMQGKEPSYLRPMDASQEKIGPLGVWEKSAVQWLSQVIDEEGRRAKQIVALRGQLIRPIEADELGPLGKLEKTVTDFLRSIRSSEKERVRTQTLRPMDMEESLRGPLGRLEEAVVAFFQEIRESERLRMQQSRSRGGEMIRPIDVPGPLGEMESFIGEILRAEEMRAKELNETEGKILRPKDAKVKGPLGEVEQRAFDFLDQLNAEEMERLRNVEQYLKEKRPMEQNRDSVLGVVEAIVVGIIRAPLLLFNVIGRVRELLVDSAPMSREDRQILDQRESTPKPLAKKDE